MRSCRTFFFEVQSTFDVILSSIHNFETRYSELLVYGLPVENRHRFSSTNRGQVLCDAYTHERLSGNKPWDKG